MFVSFSTVCSPSDSDNSVNAAIPVSSTAIVVRELFDDFLLTRVLGFFPVRDLELAFGGAVTTISLDFVLSDCGAF